MKRAFFGVFVGAATALFSLPVGAAPAAEKGAVSAEVGLLLPSLDFLIPGLGMLMHKRYVLSGTIAALRVSTVAIALDYRNKSREYRSAERAARIGDLAYGPGLRYKDPYSGDYLTADEFGRRADRRSYISGLALTLHVGLAFWSAGYTYRMEQEHVRERTPILEMGPDRPEARRAEGGVRWILGMRWIVW